MVHDDERSLIAAALRKQLRRHGIAFQQAAIREVADADQTKSPWRFDVAEYPVELRDHGTRIDFVLRHRSLPLFYVAECKRVAPTVGVWCFLRTPSVRRGRDREYYFLDEFVAGESTTSFARGVRRQVEDKSAPFFNVGFAIKPHTARAGHHSPKDAQAPGEKTGDDEGGTPDARKAIEDAAGQVCRGVGGLLDHWRARQNRGGPRFSLCVAGLIVTTAKLFSCETDLLETDLSTGNVDANAEQLNEQPWIFYQYHRSPGVTPEIPFVPMPTAGPAEQDIRESPSVTLTKYLDLVSVRTIAIVSAPNLQTFLTTHYWDAAQFERV